MNAYLTYEGALGGIVFAFCTALCLWRLSKSRKFETIDFSLLSMGLVYGLLFPIVMDINTSADIHGIDFLNSMRGVSYVHPLSVMVAAIGLIIGWQAISLQDRYRWRGYFSGSSTKTLSVWIYIMLIIAITSQYLYVRDYGGFLEYFSYNRLIRSGLFDSFERSRYSFLKPFGGFATLAFLCSWGLLLSRKTGLVNVFAFIISFISASYVTIAGGGRVSMATLIAIIPISLLIRARVSYVYWIALYFLMSGLGVLVIFWISSTLGLKSADNLSVYIARESSFVFVSFFANMESGKSYYLFYELLIWPAYLLPSSMTESWLMSATDLNTILVSGAAKGVAGVTGSIPTDIVTFGYMQANFIGILVYPIFMGLFLRIVTEISYSFRDKGLSSAFTAYVMLKIGVFAIFYAYPKHILMSHFSLLVAMIAIYALRSLRKLFMQL